MSNVTPIDFRRMEPPAPPREPPKSLEAEQGLLGAVLLNSDAYAQAASLAKPEHFSEEIHQRIFDVMGDLLRHGRQITMAGLMAYLGDHEVAEGMTTQRYLARLAASASSVIGAPEHARIIRDTAVRRALIASARKLEEVAHNARVDVAPDDVAAEALESLRSLLAEAPRGRSRFQLGDGMVDLIERMERIRRGEEKQRGLLTGFHDLDRALGGLQPGTLVVIAARVAMGKTVAMTNIADGVARANRDVGVLEFSLEIPADQLQARHLSSAIYDVHRPVTFAAILKGDLEDWDVERVIGAQRDFSRLPILVECPPKITAEEIAARIHVEKKAMAARGVTLGVVLVDYLDKISASDRYAGQRTYEIQEIVTILKSVALAQDICLVLLAQLNRGTEGREDKRPSLADLKSSSFIEQEAHAVIFVYREAYYLLKSAEYRDQTDAAAHLAAHDKYARIKNDVELIIGKNRGGAEETVHLWGDVSCSYLSSRSMGDR